MAGQLGCPPAFIPCFLSTWGMVTTQKNKNNKMDKRGILFTYSYIVYLLHSNLSTLKEVLRQLQSFLKSENYEFQIRRGRVLEDLLKETKKRSFSPVKRVKVSHCIVACKKLNFTPTSHSKLQSMLELVF